MNYQTNQNNDKNLDADKPPEKPEEPPKPKITLTEEIASKAINTMVPINGSLLL
jgi:hypothetical protein